MKVPVPCQWKAKAAQGRGLASRLPRLTQQQGSLAGQKEKGGVEEGLKLGRLLYTEGTITLYGNKDSCPALAREKKGPFRRSLCVWLPENLSFLLVIIRTTWSLAR
jgi:hypothetical protein